MLGSFPLNQLLRAVSRNMPDGVIAFCPVIANSGLDSPQHELPRQVTVV